MPERNERGLFQMKNAPALPDYVLAVQPLNKFFYVQILESEADESKYCTGITADLESRKMADYRGSET